VLRLSSLPPLHGDEDDLGTQQQECGDLGTQQQEDDLLISRAALNNFSKLMALPIGYALQRESAFHLTRTGVDVVHLRGMMDGGGRREDDD
jgi:hypothetical protein